MAASPVVRTYKVDLTGLLDDRRLVSDVRHGRIRGVAANGYGRGRLAASIKERRWGH